MKILLFAISVLFLLPVNSNAGKNSPVEIIANEPVTMMDLGILKLNTHLSRIRQTGLQGATISAKYNVKQGTIDIKVSKPVKKASKSECENIIINLKKIFIRTYDKKKVSNIHYYFQHEGTTYARRINWENLPNYVVITGVALTNKNYQDSVYCQSKLMSDRVTY